MSEREQAATSESVLPEGWSAVERVEDEITIDGVRVTRAGVAATAPSGEEITGSAAGVEAIGTVERAWFELVERAATLEAIGARSARPIRTFAREVVRVARPEELFPESPAPSVWRYARSNGVALHDSWNEACRRAELELVERHRVLEAWLGRAGRQRIENMNHPVVARAATLDWQTYRLIAHPEAFASEIEVALVVGFARGDGPMAIGFGAATTVVDAVAKATREAVQLVGFLWGEPVADVPTAPVTHSMHHLEHHQTARGQEELRRWLATDAAVRAPVEQQGGAVEFVDLTPAWLEQYRVVKAVHPDVLPLTFGQSPYMRGLPPERLLHPVP